MVQSCLPQMEPLLSEQPSINLECASPSDPETWSCCTHGQKLGLCHRARRMRVVQIKQAGWHWLCHRWVLLGFELSFGVCALPQDPAGVHLCNLKEFWCICRLLVSLLWESLVCPLCWRGWRLFISLLFTFPPLNLLRSDLLTCWALHVMEL